MEAAKHEPRMQAITLYYRFPDSVSPEIKCISKNKSGNWTWLDTKGVVHFGQPFGTQAADVARLTLANFRMHNFEGLSRGGDRIGIPNKPKKQAYSVIQYMIESDEKTHLKGEEQVQNYVKRQMIGYLNTHYMVRVANKEGHNVNPNTEGDVCHFELIDDSDAIRKETETQEQIHTAQSILKDLYENDPNEFVNFCYAYGITDSEIKSTLKDQLFNRIWKEIAVNVDEFYRINNHADRQLLSAVKMAQQVVADKTTGSTVIVQNGGYWYMDGVLLGEQEDDLVSYMKTHPKVKGNLYRKLGIELENDVELKEMPVKLEDDLVKGEGLPLEGSYKIRETQNQAYLTTYKMRISKAFKGFKEGRIPTMKDLDEKLLLIASEDHYIANQIELNEYIENRKKELMK